MGPISTMPHEASEPLIDRLRNSYVETLDRILPLGAHVVLLEYPRHRNIGDHLIWLGQTSYLSRRRDLSVHFISDRHTYSHGALERHLPDEAIVLLHGGGNFGDNYPKVQRMREAVIEHFPDHRFVQLPQTVSFESADTVRATAAVLERHPDFTLLARDRRSLEFTREFLPCKAELCVDAAFMLGPRRRTPRVERSILWLARRDEESAYSLSRTPEDVLVFDWEDIERDLRTWVNTFRRSRVWAGALASLPPYLARRLPFDGRLIRAYDKPSWIHAHAGLEMLSRAQVLVTDRLHGHIMAILLDLPHVLLDNADSKLKRFYETWTHTAACSRWAENPEQALELARALCERKSSDEGSVHSFRFQPDDVFD